MVKLEERRITDKENHILDKLYLWYCTDEIKEEVGGNLYLLFPVVEGNKVIYFGDKLEELIHKPVKELSDSDKYIMNGLKKWSRNCFNNDRMIGYLSE
jgi:hypothetical protein